MQKKSQEALAFRKLSKRHVKPQPTQSSAGYKCQDAQASFFLYFPLFSYFLLCPSVRWALIYSFTFSITLLPVVAMKLQVPVVEQEESYTSKASLLDLDEIPVYKKGQKTGAFSGIRIRRGLYRSADGTVLNADVNGAGNILRKRYPEAFDGMDLSYLWKTTKAVQIKDWYQKGEKKNGNRRHKASGASKAHHEQRKRVRREYLKLFGKSKKKRQPEAA